MKSIAARTPVLVGIGVASRREDDWRRALEPIDLMGEAVLSAGADAASGAGIAGSQQIVTDLLRGVQWIAVPKGRWAYEDPSAEIAKLIGTPHAHRVLSSVGVLQQTLIGQACERIAQGDVHTTLVVGADAGYRLLRAQIAGDSPTERQCAGTPDEYWRPADELRHPAEKRAGLKMPVGLYALIDSAWRRHHGVDLDTHREALARMLVEFSKVAASNPHAWQQREVTRADVLTPSPKNPMQALPYTRMHCSSWNVDQGAALLFCSAERATALGIDPARWVYPWVSTESNHMTAVTARADLHRCVGAEIAGRAALEAAGLSGPELDLVELYSCFPIAVQLYADALGLSSSQPLTLTGGMHFAGGPYNNYQLQSTARAASLFRAGRWKTALVSGVSGIVTKQGFGVWGKEPPSARFIYRDLTSDVAREALSLPVAEHYTGHARLLASTVTYARGEPPKAIALLETPARERVLTASVDPHWISQFEQDDLAGATLQVRDGEPVS